VNKWDAFAKAANGDRGDFAWIARDSKTARMLRSDRAGARGEGLTRRTTMLFTIAVILLVMWALGLVSSYSMGGFIHLLLVAAIVLALVQLVSGRRAL
jgi:hypothetical protein